ncbi:MAG: hypothetical protein ERJ67_03245 [Aphanocapsa feldmannii 277cV]|uniref:Nif11 family protein n=2 Tax=Aphanocapsa feldmannii TaxID=192050 RepID=A0A524RPC5_9CHRO|nr:MAG: hypothetical protein ERJ69_04865 [Aphanocapsa feldmannii 288cV]TGG93678.1 MAG: hypothetical protein ERJ67_03245 [Aphanocapsa feldmannii 277cV]TGH21038.1 MAG: hypothetical protein ERJ68_06015 [Aphanocapsa feldmannii 277cI]
MPHQPDYSSYSVAQRVKALVRGLNGDKRWNEALARAADGEMMLDLLVQCSDRIGLGLSRRELAETPPLRDWIWFKNNDPLFTVGDKLPRHQQDARQRPRDRD